LVWGNIEGDVWSIEWDWVEAIAETKEVPRAVANKQEEKITDAKRVIFMVSALADEVFFHFLLCLPSLKAGWCMTENILIILGVALGI
jgi:hypothetical protein